MLIKLISVIEEVPGAMLHFLLQHDIKQLDWIAFV